MSRLAHRAPHRVRPGIAVLTAVTAVVAATLLPSPGAAAQSAPRGGDGGRGAVRDGGAPKGVSPLADKWANPWGLSFLPKTTSALVTERYTSAVWLLKPDGSRKKVGTVPNTVAPDPDPAMADGGLLGVAVSPTWNGTTDKDVFFVHTVADGTRVVKMRFDGTSLSGYTVVISGIKRGGDHNGGTIAFGPDGYLYVTTGDGHDNKAAQDKNSLNGKILRITKSGAAAPGNPFGNRVYSLGLRNPEGLAWDSRGRLWAADIGRTAWDELNLVEKGRNYGWPTCEGTCSAPGMTNPKKVWKPAEGGVPAQVAIVNDVLYVSTLLGKRLWRLPIDAGGTGIGPATSYYQGAYGRLRAVAKVPGADQLWLGSSGNTSTNKDVILKVTIG
ncbi:PQQ-dependent sugar dehydrogenase [Streptomyces diastatochromogenes]|uniref:PQQ-dependent sugar dehydrogenase n=1 Tax=Streptomyces diastatochromogenes TaxID=42236 RepID=UPI00365ADC41